jgi:hypothetical protein
MSVWTCACTRQTPGTMAVELVFYSSLSVLSRASALSMALVFLDVSIKENWNAWFVFGGLFLSVLSFVASWYWYAKQEVFIMRHLVASTRVRLLLVAGLSATAIPHVTPAAFLICAICLPAMYSETVMSIILERHVETRASGTRGIAMRHAIAETTVAILFFMGSTFWLVSVFNVVAMILTFSNTTQRMTVSVQDTSVLPTRVRRTKTRIEEEEEQQQQQQQQQEDLSLDRRMFYATQAVCSFTSSSLVTYYVLSSRNAYGSPEYDMVLVIVGLLVVTATFLFVRSWHLQDLATCWKAAIGLMSIFIYLSLLFNVLFVRGKAVHSIMFAIAYVLNTAPIVLVHSHIVMYGHRQAPTYTFAHNFGWIAGIIFAWHSVRVLLSPVYTVCVILHILCFNKYEFYEGQDKFYPIAGAREGPVLMTDPTVSEPSDDVNVIHFTVNGDDQDEEDEEEEEDNSNPNSVVGYIATSQEVKQDD